MATQIQAFYDDNENITVVSPIVGGTPVVPDFIARLGPPSLNKTDTYYLQYELDTKNDIINKGIEKVNSSLSTLKNQAANITDTIQSGIDEATDLNNNVTELLGQYSNYAVQGQSYNATVGTGVMIFFILAAILSFFVLLGVLNVLTLKNLAFLRVLSLSRFCLNLILILGFLFSVFVFPTMIAAMEACNATELALSNQTVFNGFAKGFVSDYENSKFPIYTNTCLFADGNILANFGVEQQLNNISVIFNEMQNFSTYYNLSAPDSYVLPIEFLYINLFQTGLLPVDNYTANHLELLNSYTNDQYSESMYQCTSGAQDTWLLNSTNCSTYTTGIVFSSSDPANFNFGNLTCLGFDQYANYTPDARYNNQFQNCPAQRGEAYYLSVEGRVQGFQAHIINVSQTFTDIGNDLEQVNTTNMQYMQEAKGLVQPLLNISDQAMGLLNLVGNNQTGLITNFNCIFLQSNGNEVVEQLCVGYLPNLFVISICTLIFGVLACCGLIPIFLLEKMQRIEKRKREDSFLQLPNNDGEATRRPILLED